MNSVDRADVRHTASDRQQPLALRGAERPDLLRDETLPDLFDATVAAHGGKAALISTQTHMTYREMAARADAIARGLAARGIGPGHVVALWMTRGIDLLVAQLGIAKSGAAWLPFDAEAPVDRIAVCLKDADAKALVTTAAGLARATSVGVSVLDHAGLGITDGAPVDLRAAGLTPDHAAYMIYTSGSTGVPKGIVVSHRNICHFLRSGNALYGIETSDVMFQGASVAFDLSMEEIWIPYLVGATLFVATPEIIGETEKLVDVIEANGVTVLDTVPTLLAMLNRDAPGVRLILLGGEALPAPLVDKWARPGRRIFNTYGPTEATVVATAAEVRAGKAVTIGTPIPNYTCYVVDERLNPVAEDQQGELLIGGPGVAQGYLNRPELTADKFIANPFPSNGSDPILYRSGDAVSVDAHGAIHFHGRIDDQVKVRGFRVELGEIEARLACHPDVAQAAVVLRHDDGVDRLVAFLVPVPGRAIDRMALRVGLRDQLPPYMIPSWFEVTERLPRLTSGKVDRKFLKASELAAQEPAGEQEQPHTEAESVLLAAAKRTFGNVTIPFDADFFTDLGGHSLLAARFVSFVRETPDCATITLQDVYAFRSLRSIAEALQAKRAASGGPVDLSFEPPPLLRRFLCGLAQAVALPFVLLLMTVQWLGIFVTFLMLDGDELGFWGQLGALLGIYMLLTIATSVIGIAGKWLVIGRTKPGRYPLWGVYYFRFWLAQRFMMLSKAKWFQGTPVMRVYMRLYGAKVGKDAIIGDFDAGAVDLIEIGDRVCTGAKTKYANVEVIGNEMIIGRCVLEDDSYVGTSVVLGHDTRVRKGTEIGDLSALIAGTTTGEWEIWDGSPARHVGQVDQAALPEQAVASPSRKRLMTAMYVLALFLVPPIGLLPIFPAFWVFDHVDLFISGFTKADTLTYLPLLTWPTAMALIVLTVALVVAMRWIIMPGRLQPGRYSVHSWTYYRKWVLGLTTEVKLETLSSLFATVYMRLWYRLMGAKVGKGSEISTNLNARYDLVDIGAGNFIADEVLLGDEDIRRGWMILERVKTGDQVFIGNDAVVPPGTTIESGALIGIKSKPPASLYVGAGETWFGSPPIKLPTRQKIAGLAANLTYEPPFRMKLLRAVFEAIHTSIPTMLFITLGYWTVGLIEPMIEERAWWSVFGVFVAASVVIPLLMTVITALIKWSLMGVYKPQMRPMWSWWAMRTEAVAVLYWGLAGKVMLEPLRGTPFMPVLLRIYGTKTGKGIWMNSTDITEFDCVTIGDFCAINSASALQTHLYEDRVMKVGRVELGRGVTIGAGATVLYDTKVGDYAQIGPLCVVMKGENIPANTAWEGAPAQPAASAHSLRPAPLLLAAE